VDIDSASILKNEQPLPAHALAPTPNPQTNFQTSGYTTDVQALLPILATYLGHARYSDTAYYITATADLLGMAAERAFVDGGVV
jgi:hypothetical protein